MIYAAACKAGTSAVEPLQPSMGYRRRPAATPQAGWPAGGRARCDGGSAAALCPTTATGGGTDGASQGGRSVAPRSKGRGFSPHRSCPHALQGALLLKHGRHGRPKVHFFRVTACDTLLRWRSAAGTLKQVLNGQPICFTTGASSGLPDADPTAPSHPAKQVKLRLVTEVLAGQTTEVFRRHPLRDPQAHCFSLLYTDEQGASRTLDLTCADSQQYELWCDGLRMLAHRLRSLGMPVTAVAVSAAGTSAAADRIPGDLLAWGSAQRAPPVPTSLRSAASGQRDFWQHRSMPGLAPGGVCLDVHRAAVGRRHAAVITATGALYTWGEGRGGKLGLGHDQVRDWRSCLQRGHQPALVVNMLAGCPAGPATAAPRAARAGGPVHGSSGLRRRLLCCSHCGWRAIHVGAAARRQPATAGAPAAAGRSLRAARGAGAMVARALQLQLAFCILEHYSPCLPMQVSCGPFHCAAVSAAGQLFTWGEGFGGKLGHGDQSNRRQPALLQALVGQQVCAAACVSVACMYGREVLPSMTLPHVLAGAGGSVRRVAHGRHCSGT